MNFSLKVILTALLGFAFQAFLPWWSVTVAAFLVGIIAREKYRWVFLTGLMGIGLLWFFHAWGVHIQTEGILSDRVAGLFGFGSGTPLVYLSGLIGGLIGGLGTVTGKAFRELFGREKRRRKIY